MRGTITTYKESFKFIIYIAPFRYTQLSIVQLNENKELFMLNKPGTIYLFSFI